MSIIHDRQSFLMLMSNKLLFQQPLYRGNSFSTNLYIHNIMVSPSKEFELSLSPQAPVPRPVIKTRESPPIEGSTNGGNSIPK